MAALPIGTAQAVVGQIANPPSPTPSPIQGKSMMTAIYMSSHDEESLEAPSTYLPLASSKKEKREKRKEKREKRKRQSGESTYTPICNISTRVFTLYKYQEKTQTEDPIVIRATSNHHRNLPLSINYCRKTVKKISEQLLQLL